jgi:hypothetical protein
MSDEILSRNVQLAIKRLVEAKEEVKRLRQDLGKAQVELRNAEFQAKRIVPELFASEFAGKDEDE